MSYLIKYKNISSHNLKSYSGFTIIELLVVIALLGILAAITLVSYSGVSKKALEASLKSDLKNSSTILGIDYVNNGSYPATDAAANNSKGLPKSSTTSYQYTLTGNQYCLSATSSSSSASAFHISSAVGKIEDGVCSGHVAPGGGGITSGWKQLALGFSHACGINYADYAYCWGYNGSGQIGNGLQDGIFSPVAVDRSGVLSGKTIKAITAGTDSSCVIASDDKAYCWGYSGDGQLGDNTGQDSLVPVAVYTGGALSGKTIKSLGLGLSPHTCAIASDNMAYCWGSNYSGELGDGSDYPGIAPVAVSTSGVLSGKTIKEISTGLDYTCAIASDDKAYCWGANWNGQLGDNLNEDFSLVPVAVNTDGVLSGKTIKSISAGGYHACVIASDDKVYCWGWNSSGRLGNNSEVDSPVPVAVNTAGVLAGKTISHIANSDVNSCAVTSDNLAYCWGANSSGELGAGSFYSQSLVPVAVSTTGALSGKTLNSISAGGIFTCSIASDNYAYCWGYGQDGNLGNNITADSAVPVLVINP